MLLPISLLTIALSVLLIYFNWNRNHNVFFLGCALISLACFGLAHELLLNSRRVVPLAIVFNHITPFYLLAGPMLFFYVRGGLRDNPKLLRKDYLHFLPAFIQLFGILPWIVKPWSEKLEVAQLLIDNINLYDQLSYNCLLPTKVSFLMRPLHLLTYIVTSATLVWRFHPTQYKDFQIPQRLYLINYRWLVILLSSLGLMCLSYIAFSIEVAMGDIKVTLRDTGQLQLLSGLFFFCSSAFLLFFPDVLYGMPRVKREVQMVDNEKTLEADDVHSVGKPTPEMQEFEQLKARILHFMDTQKPFTHYQFSVADLAHALDISLNQVSFCLNQVMKVKFTDFRMKYRVAYSKQLLEEGKTKEMTIEAIGNLSGFNSRSSFYAAFREEVGMSPKEYLETLEDYKK